MVLKRGFTLVELLIVMAILVMMVVIIIGLINPVALTDKGYDAQRKKDVKRIGVAMEEYYNDRGCYPQQSLMDTMVCGGNNFAPWLPNWPCDAQKELYIVKTEASSCPKWYRVFTKLRNAQDTDIPLSIGESTVLYGFDDVKFGLTDYNYGTSSTNVDWWERRVDRTGCDFNPDNHGDDSCYLIGGTGNCNGALMAFAVQGCVGSNCYAENNCIEMCRVECCGAGCD